MCSAAAREQISGVIMTCELLKATGMRRVARWKQEQCSKMAAKH